MQNLALIPLVLIFGAVMLILMVINTLTLVPTYRGPDSGRLPTAAR